MFILVPEKCIHCK